VPRSAKLSCAHRCRSVERDSCSKADNRIRYIGSHVFELGDVAVQPYPFGNGRRVGSGLRPIRASSCAQYAIVEYWRCDALGRQSESPRLSVTARRPDGPMEAQDPGPWRKINVILPRHDLRQCHHQRR
jgi:hypothetical protein